MHHPTLCTLLNFSTYAGVALFLVPTLVGGVTHGTPFLIGGAGMAIVSGLVRAFFTEGECDQTVNPQRIP